ncbi:hypothetical protein O0Q50_22860 [Priestia aryabhattai]|uniref:Uncharacterized protein n=1 Tax=Priestia aryabhattai TaxID=412384 RepID=A0AAX6NE16_PRIAR|nr:hypothetical protein [Priestia aryabhattai]MDU9694027.1 hypothetical protein [Priestia aryabhattai]
MGKDYRKMLDWEVEREHKNEPSNQRAEDEYKRRGLDQYNDNDDDYYSGGASGWGIVFGILIAICFILYPVAIAVSHMLVELAQITGLVIMIMFVVTFYFAKRKQGYSSFFNFMFHLSSLGLFSFLFPLMFVDLALAGMPMEEFIINQPPGLIDSLKFPFYYALFMIASLIFSKVVMSWVRKKSSSYSDLNRYNKHI